MNDRPFDIETAIATWRHFVASARGLDADDLDELEIHLRDEIDALLAEGITPEEAFHTAGRRVGDYATIDRAYGAVFWTRLRHEQALPAHLSRVVSMLKHYARIALRNLRRHPGHTFLNVTGLAFGIACCLLIFVYVQDEYSFDCYHANADRIVRAVVDLETPDGVNPLATTPHAFATTVADEMPEVSRAVRFYHPSSVPVRRGTDAFMETGFFFADDSVFDVFGFDLIAGDPVTALSKPYTVVLTEDTARRLFGDGDAMGQSITVSDTLQLAVTGVVANVPPQSHFQFDYLASMASWEAMVPSVVGGWSPHIFYTYLLLTPGATTEAVEAALPDVVNRYYTSTRKGWSLHFRLQPLTSIHLYSHRNSELAANGNVRNLYVFGAIAVFILCIACINFVNLVTARSGDRMREVGMRKVLGAYRSQLSGQFLGEALLLSFGSVVLALGLAMLALPLFNVLSGKALSEDVFVRPLNLAMLGATGLGVGLLAGLYPALVLSSFRPLAVLKGTPGVGSPRGTGLLRKGLVVFQFAVSIFLIAGSVIVYAQLDFMRSRPLGFSPEQVVVLSGLKGSQLGSYETLRNVLQDVPAVRGISASNGVPGRQSLGLSFQTEGMRDDEWKVMNMLFVDPGFASTYGMKIVTGRAFAHDRDAGPTRNFILNEAAVASLGWTPEEAVGKPFALTRGKGQVVGVVHDFHYTGLQQRVEPLAMRSYPVSFGSAPLYVSLRVEGERAGQALARIEAAWHAVVPDRPFDYFFLDQDFDRQYRIEERIGRLVATFATLATIIACLGLFGLAAFAAQSRTKEIGVRKVLGASVAGVVALLSKDFLQLVVAGFVLAAPLAYFAMERWLDAFAYRVTLSWWIFALVGAGTLTLALLTVCSQTLRAATADPVKSLRYE